MIKRLVIFGATGDPTARYLLPGIAALHDAGLLPEGLPIAAITLIFSAPGRFLAISEDELVLRYRAERPAGGS